MSVHTVIKDGVVHRLDLDIEYLDIPNTKDWFHHNPTICRDDTGEIWIAVRRFNNLFEATKQVQIKGADMKRGASELLVGKLDEATLKVSGLKTIVPEQSSPDYFHRYNIEDVRLFWREDGLHGIGATVDVVKDKQWRITQANILIDYEKGVYKVVEDYGEIMPGRIEKNWSPPESTSPYFDYVYSPMEVWKSGKVIGKHYSGLVHGGTPLLPYKDGYIALPHIIANIKGEKTYATLGMLFDKRGMATHMSQLWHLGVGHRPKKNDKIEFICGAVWSKGKEGKEMLVSLGITDTHSAIVRLPVDKLHFTPGVDVQFYNWQYR